MGPILCAISTPNGRKPPQIAADTRSTHANQTDPCFLMPKQGGNMRNLKGNRRFEVEPGHNTNSARHLQHDTAYDGAASPRKHDLSARSEK
jgi:hypothetical protein